MGILQIKRIYDPVSPDDGKRILVDRMWPRGKTHEEAHLDLWAEDISPSAHIREIYHHNPAKYDWFVKAYTEELENNPKFPPFVNQVCQWLKKGNVTLLYAVITTNENNALVLEHVLKEHLKNC
ncbi:uncharacterized protein YeaO (DUF488 family) [Entomoplasma freundtii]|uniref:Uncharacterized protein n=1 Tax=Entomoplasma freundtii TaxID=74700 RepID=A0A2K8NRJ8_9MOLU|nr:DUF488 family protein [Entomoplasma freundtii]ATZ16429.1 hypothetical protein EFREU_v1c04030 [Entomoplasma freundtii]TDY56532.1 uncharacterized protein YeaO (DUF488 family) [Entomoplasma freundtii]